MTKSNTATAREIETPPKLDIRDLISFKLARVTTLNDRIAQRLISERLGISLREFRTLATISYLGVATTSAIAQENFLDHAQISRVIGTLIKLDLIERVGTAGRGGVLQLTGKGQDVMAQGLPFAKYHNARLVDQMPDEDLDRLLELIDQLLSHAQRRYREVNGEITDLVQSIGDSNSDDQELTGNGNKAAAG